MPVRLPQGTTVPASIRIWIRLLTTMPVSLRILDLNIAARNELPDFVVPQIGLSLRTIASTIRSALRRNGYAISGELTLQDSKYALRVRIDGQQVFSTNYEAENPDDLMAKAAPKIMEVIRPSVHAMVRYRFRNEEGLRKADEIIAGYDESNVNVMWAYLIRGKPCTQARQLQRSREDVFESKKPELEQRAPIYPIGRLAASSSQARRRHQTI